MSDDLPTWTPDWRVPTSKVPLHAHFEYYTYKWGAAGFTKSLWQSQDDIGRLLVEGFTVATVTQLYDAAPISLPYLPVHPEGKAESFDPAVHLSRFAMAGEHTAGCMTKPVAIYRRWFIQNV